MTTSSAVSQSSNALVQTATASAIPLNQFIDAARLAGSQAAASQSSAQKFSISSSSPNTTSSSSAATSTSFQSISSTSSSSAATSTSFQSISSTSSPTASVKTTAATSASQNRIPTGGLVGGVIGGFAAPCAVALAWWFWMKKRRQESREVKRETWRKPELLGTALARCSLYEVDGNQMGVPELPASLRYELAGDHGGIEVAAVDATSFSKA